MFGIADGRSLFTTFSRAAGDRSFCIERSIVLYNFFTGDGRSLFFALKGRSPFTTFSQATGDRFLGMGGDRFLGMGGAIAFLGMEG